VSLTLAGLTAALFAAFGPAPEAWVYDRVAIAHGEWWRLLSGHWMHSDGGHLTWNLGALLALGWIVEARNRVALLAGLLAGTIGVDLMLWLALPELTRYCGMSGVLNTVLLFALATLWRHATAPVLLATGMLSFAKIVVEIWSGQALLTSTAWASIPQAHLAGWLIGLVLIVAGFVPLAAERLN
jgi:rhomboid family GlyGly-CTERM serine protease